MRSLPISTRVTCIIPIIYALLSPATAQTAQDLSGNRQGTLQNGSRGVVPEFDVISVKPSHTLKGGDEHLEMRADGLTATNVTVHMLLIEGYVLNEDQVIGQPGWVRTDRFTIEAKVAGADVARLGTLTFDQRRSMFQQVLTDRFKLATHHEIREVRVYVLSVARGGPKFKESAPDPEKPGLARDMGRINYTRGTVTAQGTAMHYFLYFLSRELGRTVVDETGLTGKYDLNLQWTPDESAAATGGGTASGETPGPALFTAIQEQLGLKLEIERRPVDVLVIDSVEKPGEN